MIRHIVKENCGKKVFEVTTFTMGMRTLVRHPLHKIVMIVLDPDLCFQRAALEAAIAEAETLQIRTDLMLALQHFIQEQGWTPEQAAKALKQTLPRMQNLMNGEISRFSVEQLIQLLTLVGLEVQVSVVV